VPTEKVVTSEVAGRAETCGVLVPRRSLLVAGNLPGLALPPKTGSFR
jgi:hypothetical protein